MDQYVIDFEFSMLYFDMLELIEIMKDNPQLKDYTDSLQKIVDNETA